MKIKKKELPFIQQDQYNKDGIRAEYSVVDELPQCMIAHLSGIIDLTTVGFVNDVVEELLAHSYRSIILDYSGIGFRGEGVTSITLAYRDIKSAGGRLIISCIDPRQFKVFQLLGFDGFFTFTDSVEEAITILALSEKTI